MLFLIFISYLCGRKASFYVDKWKNGSYLNLIDWQMFKDVLRMFALFLRAGWGIIYRGLFLIVGMAMPMVVSAQHLDEIDDFVGEPTIPEAPVVEEEKADMPFETIEVNGVSFNMVRVKGGAFSMGGTEEQGEDADPDELPVHEVTVGDFLIGETEVTQELWEAVMGSNPSKFRSPQHPVESMRFVDCVSFFFKLNYLTNRHFRLPTEAEWEYAARGGDKAMPTKYSGSDDFDAVAWYCNNSGNVTHDVKTKEPNELGLYDMSGNVDEWCDEPWLSYVDKVAKATDANDHHPYKVRRGGGFLDFARHLRVSDRRGCSEHMWNYDIGLRLAE